MRVVDNNTFNKDLLEGLLKLEQKTKEINPENINILPFDPFESAKESAVGPEGLFEYPYYDNDTVVNGISIGKIKGMIRHLKVNKQKSLVLEFELPTAGFDGDLATEYNDDSGNSLVSSGNVLTFVVAVPEGFDGRKAFPFYGGAAAFATDTLGTWALQMEHYLNEESSSDNAGMAGAMVFQNKDTIKFEFYLPKVKSAKTFLGASIRIFFWENVL